MCGDPKCSTATTNELDSGTQVGRSSSITVGIDGNPIISYSDNDNGVLKVAICNDSACTAATITALDTFGYGSSITVGADGNPIISYARNSDLRVATISKSSWTVNNWES